jgi:hypothetical protein
MNENRLGYPGNSDDRVLFHSWINRILCVIFIVGIIAIIFLRVDYYTKSIACILWASIVMCIKLISEGEDDEAR